jgi:hypothetical protein
MTSSARAAQEPHEVLRGAPAGEQTERRLDLSKDCCLSRGETHVARQYELAAGAAHATLDLRDADQAARAEMAKQEGDRRLADQFRRLFPVRRDSSHVDVRDEVVGVGAPEHEHLQRVVRLGALNERDQVADQLGPEEIHRRGRDLREDSGPVDMHCECLERPGIRCR